MLSPQLISNNHPFVIPQISLPKSLEFVHFYILLFEDGFYSLEPRILFQYKQTTLYLLPFRNQLCVETVESEHSCTRIIFKHSHLRPRTWTSLLYHFKEQTCSINNELLEQESKTGQTITKLDSWNSHAMCFGSRITATNENHTQTQSTNTFEFLIKQIQFNTHISQENFVNYFSESKQLPCSTLLSVQPIKSVPQMQFWKPIHEFHRSRVPLLKRNHSSLQVIHCHDMMGGYLEDSFTQGVTFDSSLHSYYTTHWNAIHIFVYFSHYRVTIPPVQWIEAAHTHQVPILATFITEWDQSIADCLELLDYGLSEQEKEKETCFSTFYAEILIQMAKYYQFDGWFFNIENRLPVLYAKKMVHFLQYMTKRMHSEIPNSLVLWYDAVTIQGELTWQNELNEKNLDYFKVCDGMFINYQWDEQKIAKSSKLAGNRSKDLFFGIDLFGRGTYGGGKFDAYKALQQIQANQVSCGLFAPGFTFELFQGNTSRSLFERNENRLWLGDQSIEYIKNSSGELQFENWTILENGGDKWSITTDGFITSYAMCTKCIEIDLLSELNSLENCYELQIVDHYCGTGPKYNDLYYLKIQLKNAEKQILVDYDSGLLFAEKEWKVLEKKFALSSTIRYVYLEHGGKDSEFWAGHFGTKIKNTSIQVLYHQPQHSICNFSNQVNSHSIPFYTNFCSGSGEAFFIKGKQVSNQSWHNLRLQQLIPNRFVNDYKNYRIMLDYSMAYDGGNCIAIHTFTQQVTIPLFTIDAKRSNSLHLSIAYTNVKEEMECWIVLNAKEKYKLEVSNSNWKQQLFVIPSYILVEAISLEIHSKVANNTIYLGEIHLWEVNRNIETIQIEYSLLKNRNSFLFENVRDVFITVNNSHVKYFDIWKDNKWIQRSCHSTFILENFEIQPEQKNTFSIVPIFTNGLQHEDSYCISISEEEVL